MSTFGINNNRRGTFFNQDGQGRDGGSQTAQPAQSTAVEQKVDQVAADIAQVQQELTQSVATLSEQISTILAATTQGVEANVEQLPITVSSGHNMIGYTGVNGIDAIAAFNNSSVNASELARISIIKNSAGQFYAPQFGYSQLSMQFGQGYYLYNDGEPFTFTW